MGRYGSDIVIVERAGSLKELSALFLLTSATNEELKVK